MWLGYFIEHLVCIAKEHTLAPTSLTPPSKKKQRREGGLEAVFIGKGAFVPVRGWNRDECALTNRDESLGGLDAALAAQTGTNA